MSSNEKIFKQNVTKVAKNWHKLIKYRNMRQKSVKMIS